MALSLSLFDAGFAIVTNSGRKKRRRTIQTPKSAGRALF
jgi:hypothetical protein